MATFEETKAGYLNLWGKAQIVPKDHDVLVTIAKKISDAEHKPSFVEVEKATGVPWFMVGALLYRESSLNLNTYLGNGQPLNKVTTVVPIGRGPFPTFASGAIDALKLEGMTGIAPADWTIDRILYWCERFNGQGYFSHGNSPYIWSGTDQYHGGKFVADHKYDPNTWDTQMGVAGIFKALLEVDPTVAIVLPGAPAPTPEPVPVQPSAPTPTPIVIPKEDDPPMTTTPATTTPVQVTDPIPQIISILEAAKTYLPVLSQFLPQPWSTIVQDVIPIAEEGLQLIEDVKTKSGADLFNAIGQHIAAIGQQVQSTTATATKVAPTT